MSVESNKYKQVIKLIMLSRCTVAVKMCCQKDQFRLSKYSFMLKCSWY